MNDNDVNEEIADLININSFLMSCMAGQCNRQVAISIIEKDKYKNPIETIIKESNYEFITYKEATNDMLINKVIEIKQGLEKKVNIKRY